MSRQGYRAGVGASSIMLIFVVLSLTTLGILSLVTARNDLALTQRGIARMEAYYAADARVQRRLADADARLTKAATAQQYALVAEELGAEDGAFVLLEDVDDASQLELEIKILPFEDGARCEVLSRRLVNSSDWEIEEIYLELAK